MNPDYSDLKALQTHRGYQKLQALWIHEYNQLIQGLKSAAKRGAESAWRYSAGKLEGADLMTGQLDRALLQMEKDGEGEQPETRTAAEIISELRGEKSQ